MSETERNICENIIKDKLDIFNETHRTDTPEKDSTLVPNMRT